jgi:hypothetical protein
MADPAAFLVNRHQFVTTCARAASPALLRALIGGPKLRAGDSSRERSFPGRHTVKKTIGIALTLGVLAAALTIPSFVTAGRARVTISVDSGDAASAAAVSEGSVAFNVQADLSKQSDVYKLWVANKCSKDGSMFTAEYQPVHDGKATGFTVESGMDCTAYVWMFPSSETPMRGASVSYHVD